jgi:hypothetical protein
MDWPRVGVNLVIAENWISAPPPQYFIVYTEQLQQ